MSFHSARISAGSHNGHLSPIVNFNFPLLFSRAEHVLLHILIVARVWMHLVQQQGSIHILACSLLFTDVHNGGGMTQNTAEVTISPYGVGQGSEQPYGSTGQGWNTSVCVFLGEK